VYREKINNTAALCLSLSLSVLQETSSVTMKDNLDPIQSEATKEKKGNNKARIQQSAQNSSPLCDARLRRKWRSGTEGADDKRGDESWTDYK